MRRGGLSTRQGTWQNGYDIAIREINKEARVTSLMTATVAFYKFISRAV